MNPETGYSYDDLLLKPQRSAVESRNDPSLKTNLTPSIELETPIISAPMDTVTESEMAQAMTDIGGVGIVHRYLSVEDQVAETENVSGLVGGSVGIDGEYSERAAALVNDAGVDFLCVDVAHGHLEMCLDAVNHLDELFSVPIVAGNVATKQGAIDLDNAGADAVKVGVGPGSHCTTREVTGVGVPQASAVATVARADLDATIIADGGIRSSGDIAKALALGADTVMIGGMFGGCEESPAQKVKVNEEVYKKTHGMSSQRARKENSMDTDHVEEGKAGLTEYRGHVTETVETLCRGVQSSFSYLGASNISEAQDNAEFVRVTETTQHRNGTHGIKRQK